MVAEPPQVELHPELLLRAYASGLFPMSKGADDPELFWVDPEMRGLFPLDGLKISRSLAKAIRSDRFTVVADRDFRAVIQACAAATIARPNTWINGAIEKAYGELFAFRFAHTVEVYRDDRLVGGLYGVSLQSAFFGESMFHRETDASKVALVHLAARLIAGGYSLLDTQFVTPHLASLGAIEVPRREYRKRLRDALAREAQFDAMRIMRGEEALAIVTGAAARRSAP